MIAPKRVRTSAEDELAAQKKYYILLIVSVAFTYLRPQDYPLTFLAPLRLPLLLSLALLWFTLSNFRRIEIDRQLKWAIAIAVLCFIWIPLAKNNYYAYRAFESYALLFLAFLIPVKLLCASPGQITSFVRCWTVISALLALIVLSRGGRGPGSFVADENDVCVVLVASIPFAIWAARYAARTKAEKWLFIGCASLLMLAATYTQSRGGFLAMTACLLVYWWYSGNRVKIAAIAIVAGVLLGGVVASLLPPSYFQEMQTITDPMDSTANDRKKHWWTAWEMYKANPVFGVGPGNYPWHHEEYVVRTKYYNPRGRSGHGRQAHSLYFTLLPELGTVGTVAYLSMLVIGLNRLRSIRKIPKGRSQKPSRKEQEPLKSLATATIASTAGLLVGSVFISVLWYPTAWQWLAFYWMVENWHRQVSPDGAVDHSTVIRRSRAVLPA